MDHRDLHIPVETLEHIIELIPDSADGDERWQSEHRRTLLTCALVCNTWMLIARRCLLSLYFPTGMVKIRRDPRDVLALVDVFQSPLRTLDPAFIKVLHFTQSLPMKISGVWSAAPKPPSFRATLSILDAILFPSLETLEFDNGSRPPPDKGGDDANFEIPSLPVLFQIRTLAFRVFHCHLFNDIVHIIRLCPFVEEVTAFVDDSSYRVTNPSLHGLQPPKSLRNLILDMQALREVTDWMMACQPNYTNISSLVVYDFSWNGYINSNHLRRFLDGLGTNLKKLVLHVRESVRGADAIIRDPDAPLTQFTKNTSLKRFVLRTTQDIALDILPYLLKQSHFAPELQTIEIIVPCWEPRTVSQFGKLTLLDQHVQSRPLLCQIILSCEWGRWPEYWGEVENWTRQSLPHCEGKGVIEFRLRS